MDSDSLYCDYLGFVGNMYWAAWHVAEAQFKDAMPAVLSRSWNRVRPRSLRAYIALAVSLLLIILACSNRGLLYVFAAQLR